MTTADQYAYQLVRGFRDAEARLLELIAQTTAKRTNDIHSSQLRDVQKLRRRAERILRSVTDASPEVIHAMLAEEYASSAARVAGDAFTAGVNIDSVHTITADMVHALQASTLQVLRDVDDVYRKVVAQATNAALQSAETHQKALQAALNEAADRGLTAFYDRAGRRWSMDTYLDMALRTTRNRATQEGHIAGYKSAGVELVRASWHRASAPQCYPYQNELLAISGEAGPRVMVSEITGEAITVHVKATMREALEAGYHHPNCRHRDTPYVPGTPAPDMPEELTEEKNREQHEAQQRQRALERNVRRWKRREAAATTPQAMGDAAAGRRRAQARVREHVREHGHLSRMYQREQIRRAKGQARIPID